jgi:hypothetical protein
MDAEQFCRFLLATSTHRYALTSNPFPALAHLTRSWRLHIETGEARIIRGSHPADQVFSFFVRRNDHGASSKVPVYSEAARRSRSDGDQKALAGIALRTLESAYIIAMCGRFDLGQPHGIAALGARQDSDFGAAV